MSIEKTVAKTLTSVVTNKHTRSLVFLIITVFVIFAINAVLPTIEGKSHYTADPITITYKEYLELKEKDINYNLTWSSEEAIRVYVNANTENGVLITPIPDEMQVSVYTKFFFQHTFWYVTTITRTVSAILLFFSMFNFLLTKHKDRYKRYVELTEEMTKLSNNSLDPSTFEPWMDEVFNHDRKIKQHIDNVKYDLSRLEQRTSYKIRALAKKDPTDPRCRHYLHKREDLQAMLDVDYIEDVVIHRGVTNFKYIHASFVICGVNRLGRTTDSYSLIQSDTTRLSKDIFTKAVISTLLTVMFATLLTMTIVTAADKPWYWIVIDILTTLAPLLLQIPMAYDYCNTYMEEHLITNLLNRRTIALLYLADMQKGVKDEKDITRD